MGVVSEFEYRKGMILCTIIGEGKRAVLAKPATEAEWLEFQCELAKRGFKQGKKGEHD
jgi:hypothetical protein